jgi:aminoglycoside phosphotransferase (APT) family kinase protein
MVYETVLPYLGMPTLRYYGATPDATAKRQWLFIEDGRGRKYSPASRMLRVEAARWIGRLHVSAADAASCAGLAERLPRRDHEYYLEQARSAIASLSVQRENLSIWAEDRAVLEAVLSYCRLIEARWSEVDDFYRQMPSTLIHGDFAGRNIRYRPAATGSAVVTLWPFDWEDAAWGPPALDLIRSSPRSICSAANPDVDTYVSIVRDRWPQMNVDSVRRLGGFGKIFWYVLALSLDAAALSDEWVEQPMQNLRLYRAPLAHALRAVGWQVELR